MGSMQTTNNHHRRYRCILLPKSKDCNKNKRLDHFRAVMRSVTLRASAARNSHNSVSSSNDSNTNSSSYAIPNTLAAIDSCNDTDHYLSDFDYRKLSTLTGLSESKINELHREFLILSHNSRLSYERYKKLVETVPILRTSVQIDKLARQTFAAFDKDGNNYLDFAEFIAAYISMEKNELHINGKFLGDSSSISSQHPPITSVKRQATKYYSPHTTVVDTSSMVPYRGTYVSNEHISNYQPQSSKQYLYVFS